MSKEKNTLYHAQSIQRFNLALILRTLGLASALKRGLLPNKGEFRAINHRICLHFCSYSQSHYVKRRLTKNLHVVVEVASWLAASESFTSSHEILHILFARYFSTTSSWDLSVIYRVLARKYKPSTFALTEGKIMSTEFTYLKGF